MRRTPYPGFPHQLSIDPGKIAGLLPDYIAFRLTAAGAMDDERAIECKGHHSERVNGVPDHVLQQLADARIQGPSLKVGGGPLKEAWLFCAAAAIHSSPGNWGCGPVQPNELRVFSLDPTGEDGEDPPPDATRMVWQRDDGGWSIAHRERFADDARDLDRASLLAWAGEDDAARAASPLTDDRGAADTASISAPGGRRTRTDPAGGKLDGVELRISLPADLSLRLFFGTDQDVLDAARQGQPSQRLVEATDAFRSRRQGLGEQPFVVEGDADEPLARSVGGDGTVFEVEIEQAPG